jgi:hypothetical protein
MLRGSVLLCALLFNAPLIWQALAEQSVSLQTATIHFLITVPVVAVLLGALRAAAAPPRRPSGQGSRQASRPVKTNEDG